jgi:hypothetical protein
LEIFFFYSFSRKPHIMHLTSGTSANINWEGWRVSSPAARFAQALSVAALLFIFYLLPRRWYKQIVRHRSSVGMNHSSLVIQTFSFFRR